MEGLEATIFNSIVLVEAERLDPQFFKKEAVAIHQHLVLLGGCRLSEELKTNARGKQPEYSDDGLPVVNSKHVRSMFVQVSGDNRLAIEQSRSLTIHHGDILMNGTGVGTIGRTSIYTSSKAALPDNHVTILRAKTVQHGFLLAFLNSHHGQIQLERHIRGSSGQIELYPADIGKVLFPKVTSSFQDRIAVSVAVALNFESSVEQKLQFAGEVLLAALGLADWTPPEPLAYTARAADVFASGRFDAQYFMPAKEQVKRSLAALPGQLLSDRVDSIRDQWVPDRAPPTMRVRNYDVTDALVPLLDAEKEPSFAADIGSMKKVFKDGDVAISRLRAYLKEVAVVRTGDDIPSVGSSEFIVLRPKGKAISPETLMVFLRSAPVQTILRWCQDGSQHPRFSEGDLLSIPVPDAVATVSDQITQIVQDGFAARHRARKLLEATKRAVEIAIEDGEPAAMAYLDQAEGAI